MRRPTVVIWSFVFVVLVLMTGCGRTAQEETAPTTSNDPISLPSGNGSDAAETADVEGNEQAPVEESKERHFACLSETGNNATIGVPNTVSVSGPVKLEAGDELAIFTADGSLCAGSTIWDGSNQAISAWGDDARTEAIDGLQAGEEFQFRLWDQSETADYTAVDVSYEAGGGSYQANGITVVRRLEFEGS